MLKMQNVTKIFSKGGINEKRALSNFSLSLSAGDFVSIIGGNGAGKSTVLNCVAGVYDIDEGKIFLDGEDISSVAEHKRAKYFGRVFQDPLRGTAPSMTVEENLALALSKCKIRGLTRGIKKSDEAYFKERLSQLGLGLEDRLKTNVALLSGGQRQALTLLMAILVKPKVLLLDEHAAALDPVTAKKVMDITNDLVEKNSLCTLMVTHNMKSALSYGNRTIMMNEGNIILDLKGEERNKMTVAGLVELFAKKSGGQLDNDRMLLS